MSAKSKIINPLQRLKQSLGQSKDDPFSGTGIAKRLSSKRKMRSKSLRNLIKGKSSRKKQPGKIRQTLSNLSPSERVKKSWATRRKKYGKTGWDTAKASKKHYAKRYYGPRKLGRVRKIGKGGGFRRSRAR